MNSKDIKIAVLDIETYKAMFLVCVYLPHTEEKLEFRIDKHKNDLYAFVKFMREGDYEYAVTFNGLGFDSQVLQFILDNYEKWVDLSNLDIVAKIYQDAQNIIDNQNYNIRPKYQEKFIEFKNIDLFKIWHFDNENKRVSLKALEFYLDMDIETLPVYHGKESLTDNETQSIIDYCWKDVDATYALYKLTIGDIDNPLYAGKDKLQIRFDLSEELGLPCLNWNDVKIGEEWNRKDYMERTKRKFKETFPKSVRYCFGKKYREFFPKTAKFQTPEVKKFIQRVGNEYVINKKQEFKIDLGDNRISIGKGGIHSSEKGRIIRSDENFLYIQADIGSQYPNAYRKYGLYPKHLGKVANEIIGEKIVRRLEHKRLYKETKLPKWASLAESGKFALNGGLYGKLKQKGSFLEDHVCQLQITMGCQLEILMIVEALVDKGFNVVSLNTDGFDTLVDRKRLDEYYEICSYYEKVIGNDEIGQLEYTEFDWIVQLSVNDYLAKEPSGKLKQKGDFCWDIEIHKNKSRRIIPIALREYFVNGVLPEETIKNHDSIFDFCILQKATRNFFYEGVDRKTGDLVTYDKLIRYYISTEGQKLYKVKREDSDSTAPDRSECEADVPYQTVFNTVVKQNMDLYKIDYEYYIDKTYELIGKIQPEVKRKRNNDKNGVMELF